MVVEEHPQATAPASLVGTAITAGTSMLSTLPGQFLALCLINVLFVCGLLLFLSRQGESRERVINTVLTACLERQSRQSH